MKCKFSFLAQTERSPPPYEDNNHMGYETSDFYVHFVEESMKVAEQKSEGHSNLQIPYIMLSTLPLALMTKSISTYRSSSQVLL
jgi:hypothetical protein